jgi:hypothetical protein
MIIVTLRLSIHESLRIKKGDFNRISNGSTRCFTSLKYEINTEKGRSNNSKSQVEGLFSGYFQVLVCQRLQEV